ncbi:hypothetical protein G6F46_004549 [Rhizopus delemar]|nr:hypothetical protein G6F55_003206 [Rhizopus delemar]KAG1546630.1 hypothetical protein G6F51_004760 [Rhizopus arrhizus]KAG1500190.1 hypothetical protein G6F54_003892 [Rhizopus delemar]KAG1513911.1 hypothetical protein G6F53_004078 [Rhizopus delemar]KAG1558454.1 hypothetical protein G6F49_004491 [Rhizopus delemar]
MSKIVIDTIERTKEYNNFIEHLKTFHNKKGTTLLAEPVLGGKKIDLHKLYKEVIASGGFEQVTKKRTWKQIGDIFDLPATCTNSAYILKGLYIRNLLGWEEEHIWCKHHDPSSLSSQCNLLPAPILPYNMIKRDEASKCSVSEQHHLTQPIDHIHSIEPDGNLDCVTGTEFDEDAKKRILPALQSNNPTQVELALNKVVTISYECPQKLLLSDNLDLLEALLQKADVCLQSLLFSHSDDEAQQTILKILHIMRNFSFIQSNTRALAVSSDFKQMLIKCLVLPDSSHYSHCIDILENMTPFVELGPFDSIIGCLNNLLMTATERSVVLGSIRILTILASSNANLHYLLPTSTQVAERVAQYLIANDEELIGVSLEYLYQYSRLSTSFSQYLLSLHSGADIGIMVSLLMVPSKYFSPMLVQDTFCSPLPSPSLNILNNHHKGRHGSGPCVPDLASYQQLDEPYRCLGWLKDKFELTHSNSELSLDDMYLLYEMRFGHEKALRMKEFYTVLKIAFPIAITGASSPQQGGAVLEGTTIRGLQLKLCILQDGSDLMCQWTNCNQTFDSEQLLQTHVLHDHLPTTTSCMWSNCEDGNLFQDQGELTSHIQHSHLLGYTDDSDIQGVALVAAQLLKVLSQNPNSHARFMPYERELILMSKRRPKLLPFIESMFSNFQTSSTTSSVSSRSSI